MRKFILLFLLTFCCVSPVANYKPISAQQNNQNQAEQALKQGIIHLNSNSLLAAQNQLEKAVKLYQQLNDTTGQKEALIMLGFVNYRQENYNQALQILQRSQSIPDSKNLRHYLLTTQGLVHLELGNYQRALTLLQQASGGLVKDIVWQNRNRIALGETYRYLGWYERALVLLQQGSRVAGDRNDQAHALNSLGDVYFDLGQYNEALNYYQQALRIRKSVGDRIGSLRTLNNLGRVKVITGNLKEAEQFYQQALSEANGIGARRLQINTLNNLGLAYLKTKAVSKGLDSFQQALSLTKSARVEPTEILYNIGLAYQQLAQYPKAVDYYQQAIAWSRKNGDRIHEAKAANAIGEVLLQMGQPEKAVQSLQQGIQVFELLRPGSRDENKVSLFETQFYAYSTLQQALVAKGDYNTALTIAEKGRARAFAEQLAIRLSQSQLPELKPITLGEIQKVAKNQQATLVTYSVIQNAEKQEKELYTWVVNPQGQVKFKRQALPQTPSQPDAISLTNLVSSLRDHVLRSNSQHNVNNTANITDTYQLLIQPIAEFLPKDPTAQVIIIPQGSLFLVPFVALKDSQGKYLIEKHTISIAPSIQTLLLTSRPQSVSKEALIIGNPSPMPEGMLPLPGTETEALEIAKMLNTQPLIGQQATENVIIERMTKAGIIHLATHGIFNERQGLNSSLALAAINNQDGLLTALEIIDLKLNANLAVLSACDTGRGQITGDGVIGLSRAFMGAGVPTVVASLWAVPDESTATLMTEFYRQMPKTPNKAQALRQAMFITMKKNSEPVNWAGFVVIGQP
jgi:CHAT domain-containing protein/Flp pilus assembly protein TadD